MKIRLAIILLTVVTYCTQTAWSAPSAESILREASAKLKTSKSIEAAFTLTSSGGASTSKGTVLMSGERFRFTTPELISWFDGTTQWVLNKSDKEVNVSTPSPQELQMINPIAIINSFSKYYTPTLLKSPATQKVLKLTAKDKTGDIRQAVITLDAKNLLPQAVTVTGSNGQTFTIKLNGLKHGKTVNVADFRFNPKQYPGFEVVDLR